MANADSEMVSGDNVLMASSHHVTSKGQPDEPPASFGSGAGLRGVETLVPGVSGWFRGETVSLYM